MKNKFSKKGLINFAELASLMNEDMEDKKENWNQLGISDPLWAISSFDEKKGNKWEINDFFKRGLQEITEIMMKLEQEKIIIDRKRALDFGCGVGRCTQALAGYFDTVEGLDIAPSMILRANTYNLYGGRVTYHSTDDRPLNSFKDNEFDLIWCTDVLQHMDPEFAFGYLKDFLRILSPKGILVVQIPSEFEDSINNFVYTLKIKNFIVRFYRTITRRSVIEYHIINKSRIIKFFGENESNIVKIFDDLRVGVRSYRYVVSKNPIND